jgi:hypothetical protein
MGEKGVGSEHHQQRVVDRDCPGAPNLATAAPTIMLSTELIPEHVFGAIDGSTGEPTK